MNTAEALIIAVARLEDILQDDDAQAWKEAAKAMSQLQQAVAKAAPAQEMTLTDEEIDAIASKYMSTVGDHWCNEEAIRERHAEDFARAIISALRAKGGK